MHSISKLILAKGKERSVLRRHPWVFSGAVQKTEGALIDGEVVAVIAFDGQHLGYAHVQNGSIVARMLTFDQTLPDQNFYNERIQSAYNLRHSLNLTDNSETSIYRLVHGEGDFLPGLIVDVYNNNCVIQMHSIGMFQDKLLIQNALVHVFGEKLKSIYMKSSGTLPQDFAAYSGDAYLFENANTPVIAKEYRNEFYIDWITGQKTGFFIDQRENRALIAKYAKGKKVLNTFCYSGGFSVYALNAGAELVHSTDASKKAIDLTDQNISLLGALSNKHKSFVADTMDFVRDLTEDYDIIILDPPAFAKHKAARHNAIQGYKRLNAQVMRQIKSGGILFTFSCSQLIDKELFTNTVVASAIESGRQVRILEQLHQPADHPINANHPEGEYLKGLVVQVL